MREFFFTLIFATCLSCSVPTNNNADSSVGTANAIIVFNEYEHNFGKVEEGKKVKYTFTFENKGSGSLVIQSVTTSCGCTVPKYNRKPVAPGKGDKLEVEFDTSDRDGMQGKTIIVKSNATTPVVNLRIMAEVTKAM